MGLADDPETRARQLANLAPGERVENLSPGAGAWQPGDPRVRRHGGYAAVSAERMTERVAVIFDALAADAPLRDGDDLPRHDSLAVHELAEALEQLGDVRAYLAGFGWADRRERRWRESAMRREQELANRVGRLCEALGMTPRARAALGVDLARTGDLAAELEAGREARRRAEARVVESTAEDGGGAA